MVSTHIKHPCDKLLRAECCSCILYILYSISLEQNKRVVSVMWFDVHMACYQKWSIDKYYCLWQIMYFGQCYSFLKYNIIYHLQGCFAYENSYKWSNRKINHCAFFKQHVEEFCSWANRLSEWFTESLIKWLHLKWHTNVLYSMQREGLFELSTWDVLLLQMRFWRAHPMDTWGHGRGFVNGHIIILWM